MVRRSLPSLRLQAWVLAFARTTEKSKTCKETVEDGPRQKGKMQTTDSFGIEY